MNELDKKILQNITVLYVEDEIITRSKTVSEIKEYIGKLYTAKDGTDGIQKFEEFKPDVLVTDLIMPDMTGIELGRELRRRGYNCPIIVTSAMSDTNTILESVDVGIEKYIIKPFDSMDLLDVILKVSRKLMIKASTEPSNKLEKLIEGEEQKNITSSVRRFWGNFLKSNTGKGATHIDVNINKDVLTIRSKDNLTVFEKKLIDISYDSKIIDFTRAYLYKGLQMELEEGLSELCDFKFELIKVEVDSKNETECLEFAIKLK